MIGELSTANKLVGVKQSMKALQAGVVEKAFIAEDADDRVIGCVKALLETQAVQTITVPTMKELGKAVGIDVGAAVVVVVQ
ncbi:MAG: ribosomal L7Ae/L30e/S12e/Gadd45 family protein [Hyphomonadaceae bacterium]|nr:ribosomal L7Ae/L30e/S12e/Gadd45 family protein [Clostridia bacterium]